LDQKNQDLQHELGKLLQKDRNPELGEQVAEILSSGISIDEQIIRIKKLDSSTYLSRPKKKSSQIPQDILENTGDELNDLLAYDHNSLKRVIRHQQSIINKQKDAGFFDFLFTEFRKIQSFARDTLVLEKGVIMPRFWLHNRVRKFWEQYLQKKSASPMASLLDSVLQEAWHVLEKEEYNLLTLLRKFISELSDFQISRINFKDRHAYDHLHAVFTLYFSIAAVDPRYSMIIESLDKVKKQFPAIFEGRDAYKKWVSMILTNSSNTICLASIVRGCAMMRYKRFFYFHELFDSSDKDLLWKEDFDCDREIRSKIHENIKKLLTEIEPVRKRLDDIEKMRIFLPMNEKSEVQNGILESLYQFGGGKKRDFSRESENMIRFGLSMVELFQYYCTPFLHSSVKVRGRENVRMFASDIFASVLPRLQNSFGKLEKLSFNFPNFPRRRFSTLRKAGKGAITIEADALMILDEIVSCFLEIAALLMASLEVKGPNPDGIPFSNQMFHSRSMEIPHLDQIIETPGPFDGMQVRQALIHIVSMCNLIAYQCESPMINRSLQQEEQLRREYSLLMQALERLSARSAFIKLKEKIEGTVEKDNELTDLAYDPDLPIVDF
jgi:hypothetical protein